METEETLTKGTVVFIADEPWILKSDVRAKQVPAFKCPHCGGTNGTWFDRSFSVDSDGSEIETMCDRCKECGKRVANGRGEP